MGSRLCCQFFLLYLMNIFMFKLIIFFNLSSEVALKLNFKHMLKFLLFQWPLHHSKYT